MNIIVTKACFVVRAEQFLKGIGKEFQQLVIRRYLETSIHKKLFCHLQSLQIKSIFSRNLLNLLSYYRGVCDLYLWRS